MNPEKDEPMNWVLWVALIFGAMAIIFGLGNALMGEDPPNNEPYTGVCLEPTPQLGC